MEGECYEKNNIKNISYTTVSFPLVFISFPSFALTGSCGLEFAAWPNIKGFKHTLSWGGADLAWDFVLYKNQIDWWSFAGYDVIHHIRLNPNPALYPSGYYTDTILGVGGLSSIIYTNQTSTYTVYHQGWAQLTGSPPDTGWSDGYCNNTSPWSDWQFI